MGIESRCRDWLPAILALTAFLAFSGVFTAEILSFHRQTVGWARGDLKSRANLAASSLDEPLRTQDFRRIREFGDRCVADEVRLRITIGNGGLVFDTVRESERNVPMIWESSDCNEYRIAIGLPERLVMKPFRRAIVGFVLAGSVGVAGVLLFFFATYRQRVRIRELKRIERFRREFIADVSHEIKTPLTGILGAVDMLEGSSPLIPLIRKESIRLNGLVQSILDLARLERDGVDINPVETDVAELVAEVISEAGIKSPDVKLTLNSPSVSQGHLRIDPQLVAQAISNLIGNAVRHSGSKEVFISLTIDGRKAEITVEDHGIGIPAEYAENIFERFHRVDPARAAETGGAGLGLAIVRRIARLHGGDVKLLPVRPHGCKFVLTLFEVH